MTAAPYRPSAYLTTVADGSARRSPAVALRFSPRTPHPSKAGERMVDWVKDLGLATWDHPNRRWLVTEFDTADPDRALAAGGFATVGPDGEPVTVSGYRSVLVEPAWPERTLVAVYPRLIPEPLVRTALQRVSGTAQWRNAERRFLVPAADLVAAGLDSPDAWSVPVTLEGLDGLDVSAPTPSLSSLSDLGTDGTLQALRSVDVGVLKSLPRGVLEALERVGITSLFDLLTRVPRRYIDRSNPVPVADSEDGDEIAFIGTVTGVKAPPPSRRGKGVSIVRVVDADGTPVTLKWFNAPRITRRYHVDAPVLVHGKVEVGGSGGSRSFSMVNPMADVISTSDAEGGTIGLVGASALIPIYPQSAKADLTTWATRGAVSETLQRIGLLTDTVPPALVARHGLVDLTSAWTHLHAAASASQVKEARRRLAYDELLRLHLALRITDDSPPAGFRHEFAGDLARTLAGSLPFGLTGAQKRAANEISADLRSSTPMHRIVQGEVGSGKTLVAAMAALMAVEAGQQVALMTPTDVLADQHHSELAHRISEAGLDVRVELLSKSVTGKRRRDVKADLESGAVDIVVGTQAVLFDVPIPRLSLVIVDEQHRFGVTQRHQLRRPRELDGATPGLLVMTATPAPRTAAMLAFGDLELSVLDEVPAGREPVLTSIEKGEDPMSDRDAACWRAVREAVSQGRQAFVVSPLVSDSAARDAAGAHTLAEQLPRLVGTDRVGVVTGKQKYAEREEVMGAFTRGEIDVLVATTVIEVGVNVPNATVIVITGAESFGITQLHQLRGRVGRGKHPGRCFLVPGKPFEELAGSSQERLTALAECTDGFELAERDLAIRGPGRILSAVQAGRATDLLFSSLVDDAELVAQAGADAAELLADDPGLNRRPMLRAEVVSALGEDAGKWLRSA